MTIENGFHHSVIPDNKVSACHRSEGSHLPELSANQNAVNRRPSIPRMLFRGALSLPDSHLLLDGLTFTIQLPSDDPQATRRLLETPLPLALESMRGRPSLGYVGVVKMDSIQCDFESGVTLHIHSRSILTRQLFEHNLCIRPVDSPSGHTDVGIRVRLGDQDGPGSTTASSSSSANDIVVYGKPHPYSSFMQLCVARILPDPPPKALPKAVEKLRPPRPDDPTPRRPPVGFVMSRIGVGIKRPLKRENSEDGVGSNVKDKDVSIGRHTKKKQKMESSVVDKDEKITMSRAFNSIVRDLGKSSRVGNRMDQSAFKAPPPPPTAGSSVTGESRISHTGVSNVVDDASVSELEADNKAIVKKSTMRLLSAAGVGRQHPEFKEFFSHVYRGASFSLREKLKTVAIASDQKEEEIVERIIQSHVTMYLGGQGIGVYLLQ